jgi:hypothetical protein
LDPIHKIIDAAFKAAKNRCDVAATSNTATISESASRYDNLFHFCGQELCKLAPAIKEADLAAGMFCAATDTGLRGAKKARQFLLLGMCPLQTVTMATGLGLVSSQRPARRPLCAIG